LVIVIGEKYEKVVVGSIVVAVAVLVCPIYLFRTETIQKNCFELKNWSFSPLASEFWEEEKFVVHRPLSPSSKPKRFAREKRSRPSEALQFFE